MRKITSLTALGAVFMVSNAYASGFHLKEQSTSAMGNAFAGATSAAEDASYSYFNVAGLTMQKGTQIIAGASFIAPHSSAKYAIAHTPLPIGSGTAEQAGPSGDIVKDATVPHFYISHQVHDDWTIGLSYNTQFGMSTKYDANWTGRYHGTLSDLRSYTFTPMVAYKMDEKMSVGVGVQVQHISARLRNSVLVPTNSGGLETRSLLDGDTTDLGFMFGFLYEYRDDTRFGIGYRSRIRHKIKGDLTFDLPITPRDVDARLVTPAVMSVGIYHDINDKWSVMADFSRTYWESFDSLTIMDEGGVVSFTQENWKNTNFYSIGASYQLCDKYKVRFGLGFDKSAVKKHFRTPRVPDSNRKWVSTGLEYKYDDNLSLNLAYTYIKADSGKIMLDGSAPGDAVRGSLYSDYNSFVNIVSVGFAYKF